MSCGHAMMSWWHHSDVINLYALFSFIYQRGTCSKEWSFLSIRFFEFLSVSLWFCLISKQGHVTGKSFSIKEGLSLLSLSFLSFFLSLFEGQNRDGYKYTELISDSCSLSLSSALQFYSSSWYQSLALTDPSLEYLSIIGYSYLLVLR
jgi:hypothetical protein